MLWAKGRREGRSGPGAAVPGASGEPRCGAGLLPEGTPRGHPGAGRGGGGLGTGGCGEERAVNFWGSRFAARRRSLREEGWGGQRAARKKSRSHKVQITRAHTQKNFNL